MRFLELKLTARAWECKLIKTRKLMWLQATLQNLAIDAAGVGVFGFLLRREFNTKSKAEGVVEQEEALGRLQVRLDEASRVPDRSRFVLCRTSILCSYTAVRPLFALSTARIITVAAGCCRLLCTDVLLRVL